MNFFNKTFLEKDICFTKKAFYFLKINFQIHSIKLISIMIILSCNSSISNKLSILELTASLRLNTKKVFQIK